MRLVLGILLCLCSLSLTRAQQFAASVQQYGPEQGLSHREVNAIFQDRQGFMWFGTKFGLNRFDGLKFTAYSKERNGLGFDDIQAIAQDADGLLWLMGPYSQAKITLFNPLTGTAVSFEEKFKKPPLANSLASKQRLFGSDNGTIYFANYQPATLVSYHPKSGLHYVALPRYKNLTVLHVTPRNTVWAIAGNTILVELTRDGRVIHEFKHDRAGIEVCLGQRNAGIEFFYLAYGTPTSPQNVLYSVDGVGNRRELPASLLQRRTELLFPVCYAFDRSGLIWNGTQLRGSAQGTLLDLKDQLAGQSMENRCFFRDKNGWMWLGTSFGVYQTRVAENYFHRLFYEPTHAEEKAVAVRGITVLGDKVYANLEKMGLFTCNLSGGSVKNLFGGGTFYGLSHSQPGKLYVGQINQLATYNLRSSTYTTSPLATAESIWTLHPFSNQHLIAGGLLGLWLVDAKAGQVLPFTHYNQFPELAQAHVLHIAADRQGTLWLCTNTGLYTIDPLRGVTARYWSAGKGRFRLPADSYQHFYQDPRGLFWLATANSGLIRWDRRRNSYRQFRRTEGLSNNTIYAVYADRRGHLWLSSDYGIMQFDPLRLTTRSYSVQDGITHNEFNRIAHFQANNGQLYFGGLNGITSFDPSDFEAEKPPVTLPLRIVSLRQFDHALDKLVDKTEDLLKGNQIILQPGDRTSVLDVALLNYADAQNNVYAYQFKGLDNEWTYQTEPSLRLGNLPYGEFQLLVKGQAADGRLSSANLAIQVIVLRPFYLRGWFLILMAVLLTATVWGWLRWRIWSHQNEQKRLQTQIQEATHVIARQAQDLRQLDETKSRFFANISHEFRTPLTLILAPTEQLMSENRQPKNRRRLQLIEQNAHQLLRLINQLLDLSKLEAGVMPVHPSRGDLTEFICHWLQPFIEQATAQGLSLTFDSGVVGDYWFDAEKLERIVYNLTANALKFTETGTIRIAVTESAERIRLTVADTGVGMQPHHLPHIFDRFYQVGDRALTPGTGIGLALVHELVQLQGGVISVESQLNQGTTFVVELPYQRATESATAPKAGALSRWEASAPAIQSTDTPVSHQLLIVEDNDELAQFIADSLPDHYRIRRAANGRDGLEQALAHLPDLIISDVMMPLMDGFTLCGELKTDLRTSHIPVILLTAKASPENRLAGLSLGADDYLAKPFQLTELHLRVRNQLATKQRQREWIQASLSNPDAAPLQPTPDPFLTRLYALLDAHLSDSGFGLDQMTAELGLSRTNLFRKVKALTNLTAHDLLRNYRLKRAAHLLRAGHSVSETAYQVGFESPAYFSKCFRELYQLSPREFSAQTP
ncbi:MAG: response regulator [Bacteroidetes bacterium]|nr:response regulator [Fibrella sp.]